MWPSAVWVESARDMRARVEAMVAEGFKEDEARELVLLSMGRQPPKPAPEVKKPEEPANA